MKAIITIGAIVSLVVLPATITFCQPIAKSKTRVVFVCEHGGARSTIASLYFNKMAKENNLPYESVFRAIVPDSTISPETKKGLLADGFDSEQLVPAALTSNDITNAILISIDCRVTSSQPDQEWTGIPAIRQDYKLARNEIVRKLTGLINELKKKNN
jgi:arsenate reductase (thioredoxin)